MLRESAETFLYPCSSDEWKSVPLSLLGLQLLTANYTESVLQTYSFANCSIAIDSIPFWDVVCMASLSICGRYIS